MAWLQTDNLRLERSDGGVATLWLEVVGRAHNLLGRGVLLELEQACDRIAADGSVRLLVLRSNKTTGFVAGADLHELAAIRSAEEAVELSALGQRVFGKLADLRAPSLAILKGACLGGGLELALACDYRLGLDEPPLELGLPEVQLGLLPGWGGTQRLPRRVGLQRALRVILGSQRLRAADALDWGLVDHLAADESQLEGDLKHWLERALRQGKRQPRGLPLRTWKQWLIESTSWGRALVLRGTERVLRQRVPDDMPAPWEALAAVRTGLEQGLEAGLEFERAAIGRLARSRACRNLINLFFFRDQARKLPDELLVPAVPRIAKVGVVGAGVMGAGIAQLAAVKGFDVVVQEVNEHALAAGMKRIESLLEHAVARRILSPSEARQKREAIGGTTVWNGFADVDVVVEAAVEDLSAKQAIFRELEKRTRPTAILTSNTSSLSVTRMQQGLQHPGRVAGMHFFNPVHRMPLVEVIRTVETERPVLTALVQWAIDLGKTPVVVKDSPGFIVNRILIPYLNEAVLLLQEGAGGQALPVERIDRLMRRFGMPMGPLELLDQIGLDVASRTEESLRPAFGERFSPNPVFARMCARGWLGQKSNLGFYRYHGRKKRVNDALAAVLEPRSAAGDGDWDTQARERMVLLMVNEAAACFDEGLTEDAATLDLAMIFGTNWAPHRGGPLRYADDRGAASIVASLEALAARLGPRFEPSAELRRRAQSGELFYGATGSR
jgi:3-hydroxyacyl-CoA dehydrogenase/enoyl-CoA hydratase/3-hydroxybutyryl-CoA epimerase